MGNKNKTAVMIGQCLKPPQKMTLLKRNQNNYGSEYEVDFPKGNQNIMVYRIDAEKGEEKIIIK